MTVCAHASPAPGVPVTRQRGAAAGQAHPPRRPGPSRGEGAEEQRQAGARARPGEPAEAEGDAGGPQQTLGACLVSGWRGALGPRAGACGCLRDRACCRESRVGSAAIRAPLAGLRLCRTVCVRARVFVWRGRRLCLRMSLGCHCAAPGLGVPACPGAVPPARGCFPNRLPAEPGSAAAQAGGGTPPPQASRDPERPGDCRLTPEEGEGRTREGPEPCPQG